MTRYRGFQEWLLEQNEDGSRNLLNEARDASNPSMRDAVDKAAAELRFRDEQWQANRDKWFADWKRDRPTEDFGEYVNHLCDQIRSGK